METEISIEEKYPSVDLAYEIAIHSYDVSMKRLDEKNGGFERLRSWITTINLAFLVWVLGKEPITAFDFFFFAGLSIFFFIVVLTIIGQSIYAIWMPDPMKIFNTSLHQDHWNFKKNFIYRAGEDFCRNAKYVNRKANYIAGIFTLFLFEVVVMGYWLLLHPLQK